MNDSNRNKAKSRAPTEEELFYQKWGYETLKANIKTVNEVLKQLITINVTLLGGGVAFIANFDVSNVISSLIMLCFFIGLIVAFLGAIPYESEVDIRIPLQIKRHKKEALKQKRRFLFVAGGLTLSGLFLSICVVTEIQFLFNSLDKAKIFNLK